MPLVAVLIGIIVLLILIIRFKIPAFIALIVVSIGVGVAQGMDLSTIMTTIQKGVGSTLGYLALVLGLGAMLGELLAQSGAARQISDRLIAAFGLKHIHWALMLTGFIVGIPLFYTVGFVMLVPLIFSLAKSTKLPLLYLAIPMVAALSVTHGFLPPHPAPTTVALIYGADMGLTLIYGIIIAIPTIIIAGPLFSQLMKKIQASIPSNLYHEEQLDMLNRPGLAISLFTALVPVLLMALSAILQINLDSESPTFEIIRFIGDPVIALLIALLFGIYALGIKRGKTMKAISKILIEAVKGVAMILLIIGAGGALKQVLIDSGISDYIVNLLQGTNTEPLFLAWGIAALLRIALGSATVAALTAAGIVTPLLNTGSVNPELLVLATGAGSLTCSQVNDTGFWLFKEYFGLSIWDTFRSWTVMETIVSLGGLVGVLILNQII